MTHHNHQTNQNQNALQGGLLLVAGFLLLLYTLNLITTGINVILIIVSIALIAYGTVASGLAEVIKRFARSVSDRHKK